VILNVEAHELTVGGKHIGLTPLEFDLMHYLTQHEGKAVSRDELLNAVWGYEYDGGSNVVDAMVRSLRKKLGAHASCIETIPRVGYKLRWKAD
jgi:DNA-binding response OmpR family regulator